MHKMNFGQKTGVGQAAICDVGKRGNHCTTKVTSPLPCVVLSVKSIMLQGRKDCAGPEHSTACAMLLLDEANAR